MLGSLFGGVGESQCHFGRRLDPESLSDVRNGRFDEVVRSIAPTGDKIIGVFIVCFLDVLVELVHARIVKNAKFRSVLEIGAPVDIIGIEGDRERIANHREDARFNRDGRRLSGKNFAGLRQLVIRGSFDPETFAGNIYVAGKVVRTIAPTGNKIIGVLVISFFDVFVDLVDAIGIEETDLRSDGIW